MKKNFFENFFNIYVAVICGFLMVVGFGDFSWNGFAWGIYGLSLAMLHFYPLMMYRKNSLKRI